MKIQLYIMQAFKSEITYSNEYYTGALTNSDILTNTK